MTRQTTKSPIDRAQLEAVLDAMADGVAILDMAGNIILVNEEEARINGFASVAEMMRNLAFFSTLYEFTSDDGRIVPVEEWPASRVLRGETLSHWQLRARRLDTRQEWVLQFSGVPVLDEAGQPVLAVIITRDITEHVRTEKSLDASQRHYRTIFQSIDQGFCLIQMLFDEHGAPVDYRFLETNDAFERNTGLQHAVGKTARELVPQLDASWFKIYGNVALTGEPVRLENQDPAMRRWFEVYASRAGHPESRQVVVVFKDITERKQTERALLENEVRAYEAAAKAEAESQLLDAVLEAAPVSLLVVDASGRLVRTNPAHERLWGPMLRTTRVDESREWKGWWADGAEHHGRRLEAREWAMTRALQGETVPGDIVEIEPFDAPGTRRTLVNSAAPVRDATGGILGAVVTQMDITVRVQAEAAVRRSQERRGVEFHDPGVDTSERVEQLVQQSNRHIDQLTRLLDDMLGISRGS